MSTDSTIETPRARRSGGRSGRHNRKLPAAVHPGFSGGTYKPLSDRDIERIHQTALDVLENIGMADPIPVLIERALASGCRISDRGRLCFPRGLVEDVISEIPKEIYLFARDPKHDFEIKDEKVFFEPGGETVATLDFETGRYRPSTVIDLYDFARLVDQLPTISTMGKPVIPTEIADPRAHNISAVYAKLSGTSKHLSFGLTGPEHLDAVVAMLDMVAGGEGKFAERPFVSMGGCPVVSPLTYGVENSELFLQVASKGMVVAAIMAPQAGATAPAALAGTLVQVTAESLAALLLVGLVHRGHPMTFGPWPFVSDLRTGAFSGGGGEQALLGAAAVQIANSYGLPSSSAAGMTDSKAIDAQSGFEKSITTVLSSLAGCNWLSEVCGMQASLMGCSFEAMAVDDEMLSVIQRVLRGIEVTDETLSYDVIDEVIDGPRHFLDHPQTLALMHTEYAYPSLADRSTPEVWEESGAADMRTRARERVRKILSEHYPRYIDDTLDAKLREHFPIRLPREAMRADCGRW